MNEISGTLRYAGESIRIPLYFAAERLTKGDRVRVKDGYEGAGGVGFYAAKSMDYADKVVVDWELGSDAILAAAIEPYPYTREERIERAIEDYFEVATSAAAIGEHSVTAILFAILDAGI